MAEPFALFDGDDGASLYLSRYLRTLVFDLGHECAAPDALAAALDELEAAARAGAWVALALDYDAGPACDPALTYHPAASPQLRAWLFAQGEPLEREATAALIDARLGELSAEQRSAGVADFARQLDAAAYAAQVARIHGWIADGDCYQINYTFPVECTVYGHPLALYARLRQRQPVRYGGCLLAPELSIISCSPELFFARQGARVTTRPMKGTAPRSPDAATDAALRAQLLASDKERAENLMIVDLLRNDLGKLAGPGGVRVDALFEIEAYPTLWQMVSTVSADLPDTPLSAVFSALFPCGSITGAPKIRAAQRIAELEPEARGLYTGAFGWLAPGGDCRFNVAIRTLVAHPGGRARLGVGSGIVSDADAEREFAECLLKASFLSGIAPDFELLESMRCADGRITLLPLHMERLQRSARALGFACDAAAIAAQLTELMCRLAVGEPGAAYKVRLALASDGSFGVTYAPLPEETRCWQAVLAAEPLAGDTYLRRHKTTVRAHYDRALAGLCATPEVFDVIFCNARGEVCEGARSNVFVERDGRLLTPPEHCGLLPGVMRRHLLERGVAVEQVLTRDDLLAAPAVYLANAVRGLLRVDLRPSAAD